MPDYDKLDAYQYFPLMWETLRNSLVSSTVTKDLVAIIASAIIADRLASTLSMWASGDIVRNDGTITWLPN